MEDLLRNSLIALGEAELTLAELPALMTNDRFRTSVISRVTHPIALEYFHRFNTLTERARITWTEPVMNKVNALLTDDRVRQMLSYPKSTFNLRELMDNKKVLLIKLDKDKLRDTADLLGSVFMAKIKMAAFSRSDVPRSQRTPFYLYIDEFQNFASDSFSVVLSEARKYGLSLIMAHQTLAQVPSDLRSITLGNTGIPVCFRVNRQDAQLLAKESFTYSGYKVKTSGLKSQKYWSYAEEWEHYTEELQTLHPRACYVKHKIQGGMIPISTVEIEPAWEVLEMDEADYYMHLRTLPIGSKYLLGRNQIEGYAQRRVGRFLELPSGEKARQEGPSSELPHDDGLDSSDGKVPIVGTPVDTPEFTPQSVEQMLRHHDGDGPQSAQLEVPIHKETIDYLEQVAAHPFTPTLQRDKALGLSRYKGTTIRKGLMVAGWVKSHKVNTGKRSGQLVLLEVAEAGYEFLSSLNIRTRKPRGRGGFTHRYYAYKLKEYAEATWLGCTATIEDGRRGRPVDVSVGILTSAPDKNERTIAFEVFITGAAKEVKGIAKDLEIFDQVIVCTPNPGSLEALKSRTEQELGQELSSRVTFSLISQFLIFDTTPKDSPKENSDTSSKRSDSRSNENSDQIQKAASALEKNQSELEPELEQPKTPRKRRGRKPKTPLMKQVQEAYIRLHDLDWLQESELAKLPEVQERLNPMQVMPEAQALRELLLEAVRQIIQDISTIPDKFGVKTFLEGYLEGKLIIEIAEELGVSREWASRAYRREAFNLAGMQFVRILSLEDNPAK